MAKYIAQVVVLGLQVVSRAFARALQAEYAASRAAAERGGKTGSAKTASAHANLKMQMTIQEAKNILNVDTMNPKEINKNFDHLFQVNDRTKNGSFYLQSKDKLMGQHILAPDFGYVKNHRRFFSQTAFNDVFSENSKKNCIERLKLVKSFGFNKRKPVSEAAVLVPLCLVKNVPSVLLTVRSSMVGRNKGDVSFPGGLREMSDKDSIHAALRETEEEIGVVVDRSAVWTVMNPFPSRTGDLAITPVIANIGNISVDDCKINLDEVESVFFRTLESLCDSNNLRYTRYKKGYILPVYLGGEIPIWGLTAGLLHVILQALLPGTYKGDSVFPLLGRTSNHVKDM